MKAKPAAGHPATEYLTMQQVSDRLQVSKQTSPPCVQG